MDPNRQMIEETNRLVKDNNRMLHAMRRHALWAGTLKFIIYAALILAPIWFYMTYLNATVEKMLSTVDQIQGTGAKAQAQISGFEDAWKQFEAKLPNFMHAPTSTKP